MSVAILTPTRERPAQLAQMLEAIAETAEGPVTVYVGIDLDDHSYPHMPPASGNCRVLVLRQPRMQLGAWTNVLARVAIDAGHPVLGSFGDDHRPRTHGWDTRVGEAFDRMGSGLVYTADGLQDERLPTAPFWSASVIRELGWFFPPAQVHLYADDFWKEFADALGRRTYLPGVLVEHLHPSATGAEPDHINVQNDSHYEADKAAFEAYRADGFSADVERVKSVL